MHPIERHCGTAAPIVTLAGILLATVLDPTFSWTTDALSDLGIREGSHLIFNGGLVVGGALALPYAIGITRTGPSHVDRLIGVLFGVAAVHLAGVGLFVIGHPLHVPAAVGFYGLVTVVYLIDGLHRRATATGRLTTGLAIVHIAIWISWIAGLWPGSGLALPEFAGALLVPIWIWLVGNHPTLVK